ncbi:GntR-family transcriptional regulator [Mesoplasma florum W37]|uniref:GntR-family transcriptional regulator n=2 Tax=Mesoplasma florum TaxID=2151 RepID=A0AAD0MNF6_MESFO|nr:GntR family transcriptional regulator [Mesoplasma florum]AGY41612.1 GntR-family transcriptional regulator [Mesoplasma florum W37]AVN65950.1 GntR-family transcriptional regulator [Mesoplasma florum]
MDKKWEIVFDYLMHLIRENKVGAGEVLPSQNMLKTKFKYSEQPIRMAFNKLIELKIVKAVNGKGYVVQDKIKNNLLFSFRELFPNSTNTYYDLKEILITEELSKKTNFYVGSKVVHFKCLRKNKDSKEIILYQESMVPKNLCNDLRLDYLNHYGFMKYIEEKTSSKVSHSSKKIYFENINDDEIYKTFDDDKLQGYIVDEGNVYGIFGELLEYRISRYKPKFFKWDFIEWRK